MIKKITLVALMVVFAFGVNAQIKLTVGGGLAIPLGDFGDATKTGFGGNVGVKYMLNENMAVGANLGYIMMGEKYSGFKASLLPITGSYTYYFKSEGVRTYLGFDAGYYSMTVRITSYPSDSKSALGFAPTAGFEYGLNDRLALDVNAKYNYIMYKGDATSYVGINVGLIYSLK